MQDLDGEKIMLFKAIFPEGKGYYAQRLMISIDAKTYLPIKTEVYGWKDEFLEMYHYSRMKINVGLTDKDFDINNTAYKF
jgi:outer membrane lipoprotein-sorting protein